MFSLDTVGSCGQRLPDVVGVIVGVIVGGGGGVGGGGVGGVGDGVGGVGDGVDVMPWLP